MLILYHHPICPFSRKTRIILHEKNIHFEMINEKFWERREEFLMLNPAANTPVIMKSDNVIISGISAIFEYFEEVFPEKNLLGDSPIERANTRRIIDWFDEKFYYEVTRYLVNEKVIKVITKISEPSSNAIRAAKRNLSYHLDYIDYLLADKNYLAAERMTAADIAAAAQLSVLDFIGDITWDKRQRVKEWYALMKSRPSFRPILFDKMPGFTPPIYYTDPDF